MRLSLAALLPAAPTTVTESAAPVRAPDECEAEPAGPTVERLAFPKPKASNYVLPFEPGKSFLVWRTARYCNPGNKGVRLYTVDMEMPIGTPLVAARSSQVVAVQVSFADGNDRDLEENFVMVEHKDRTIARYIHLK